MEKSQSLYQGLGWDDGAEGWRKVGPVQVTQMADRSWFARCDHCTEGAYGNDPAQAIHYLAPQCSHLQATGLGAHKS